MRTKGLDGEKIVTEDYEINNGVIQGDGPAPKQFLVGMHMMMHEIGMTPSPFTSRNVKIPALGYADDLANYHAQKRGRADLEPELQVPGSVPLSTQPVPRAARRQRRMSSSTPAPRLLVTVDRALQAARSRSIGRGTPSVLNLRFEHVSP